WLGFDLAWHLDADAGRRPGFGANPTETAQDSGYKGARFGCEYLACLFQICGTLADEKRYLTQYAHCLLHFAEARGTLIASWNRPASAGTTTGLNVRQTSVQLEGALRGGSR